MSPRFLELGLEIAGDLQKVSILGGPGDLVSGL